MKHLYSIIMIINFCKSYNSDFKFYQNEEVYDLPKEDYSKYSRRQWMCLILGICPMIPGQIQAAKPNLKIISEWNQLEFEYKNSAMRQSDINSGFFTPGVIAPIDVDVFYSSIRNNSQIFITIPRFIEGVPATLGTITDKLFNAVNPIIKPFPNWDWHRNPELCKKNRLISVFRIKIDECGRLWVLDTGKIGDKYLCRPQILAFDLNSNQVLHKYEFPSEVVTNNHLLVTPVVDIRNNPTNNNNNAELCTDTFIYIADVLGFALIVYDVKSNISWRIQDKTFYPYPNCGTYKVAGESFELMDGLLGLALSPHIPGQDRVLFYHAMSSPTENYVLTSSIRNYSLFQHDPGAAPQIFETFRDQRDTQVAAQAINKNGIMFFGLIKHLQIACWNSITEYGEKNFEIIANDPLTLQFPSGIKIIKNKSQNEELWILTSRFQKVAAGSLNSIEKNFRILAGKVEDLIFSTKCKTKHSNQNLISNSGGYGIFTG